jgi:hypothetical protein
MSLKTIDFRPARHLSAVSVDPLREPDLRSLLRGKALGGPCNGATIEGPASWDGLVGRGSLGKPYPGRYVYSTAREWVWQEDTKTESS